MAGAGVVARNVVHVMLLCIGAAIAYGLVHDQITAHLCVEYFSVAHAPLIPSQDPTILGLGWGIIATWWTGLLLGLPLGLLAQVGPWPTLAPGDLVRPVLLVMLVSAGLAVTAGVTGAVMGWTGAAHVPPPFDTRIPLAHQVPFLADWYAHTASYAGGTLGALAVWTWVVWRRGWGTRPAALQPPPGAVERAALRILP